MIKAIQTKYKGYRFRSRLEARWAVFFDSCGYNWEYEAEGYVLPCGTYYLPDFKVWGEDSNGDYNVFLFEVKPSEESLFDKKISAFQDALWVMSDKDVDMPIKGYGDYIILDGTPDRKLYHGTFEYNGEGGRQWLIEPWYRDRPSFWESGQTYDAIVYDSLGLIDDGSMTPIDHARSARFEHGESGYKSVSNKKDILIPEFSKAEIELFEKKEELTRKFLLGKKCHYENCKSEPKYIGDLDNNSLEWQRKVIDSCDVTEVEKYCIPVCTQHYHEGQHDGYDNEIML